MVSVPISSKDQHIVSSGDDYALRVWSLTTAEVIKVLQGHGSCAKSVAISTLEEPLKCSETHWNSTFS